MNRTMYIIEVFCLSGVVGVMFRLLGNIELPYIILLMLVVLDTVTGVAVALKHRRFSSEGLGKLIKKVITYTVSIITIRLLEIGILPFVETTWLSQMLVAFLEIKEAISTLENLTLLGVPIPANFTSLLLNHLKIPAVSKALRLEINNEKDLSEIDEIIQYQLPLFENNHIRRMLEINFKAWKKIIMQINHMFDNQTQVSNELMHYKILALIELELTEAEKQWSDEKIPKEYINKFHRCHQAKLGKLFRAIERACFSQQSTRDKKEQVVDSIITSLYQTVLDGRKCIE